MKNTESKQVGDHLPFSFISHVFEQFAINATNSSTRSPPKWAPTVFILYFFQNPFPNLAILGSTGLESGDRIPQKGPHLELIKPAAVREVKNSQWSRFSQHATCRVAILSFWRVLGAGPIAVVQASSARRVSRRRFPASAGERSDVIHGPLLLRSSAPLLPFTGRSRQPVRL